MENSRTQELIKKTYIITIGRVSTQFITFLLLPLYTALLTKEEYGIVDLITTLVQLIVPVVSLMIDQGAFRHLLNCETEKEKKKVISSAFFLLLLTSLITIVVYVIISRFSHNQYKIWLLLILIATAFSNFFLQIARGLKQTTSYAIGSFVCSASTIVLNVLCIAFFRMGATGMLIATFAGNAICNLFLFLKLRIGRYISFPSVNKAVAKDELLYSVPLIPNQLSIWVMNSSDRLIVTFFLGAAANGILAVSHKFPAIYITFFNIFLLAWHETGAIHYFDEDRDQFFTDTMKKILSVFSTLCIAIIVILPIIFNWFVNSAYNEAYYNVPIYLVASLFNVIIGLLGVVYVATKKTTEIAKTTIIAAIINIVVHIVLIKYISLYAASVSTLVGYFLTLIYRVIDTRKYLKIKYDIKQITGISASIGVACFVYYLNNKIVSLILLPFFLLAAYIFNKDAILSIVNIGINKIGRARFKKHKKVIIYIILFVFIVALGTVGAYIYFKVVNKSPNIANSHKMRIVELEPKDIVYFSEFNQDNFTCTGITYDQENGTYWIADCGLRKDYETGNPRIVEVDGELSQVISEVNLSNVVERNDNLQGVAYDSYDDMFWIALGGSVVQINRYGERVKDIPLGDYSKYQANGVCYDPLDDSIWVLCFSKHIIHYSKDGSVLSVFDFNYADQDHLLKVGDDFYITVGADYKGDDNFVCCVSAQDGNIEKLYRVKDTYAIEGISYNGKDFFIVNDGYYHDALIKESYISVFNGEEF